ncbi:SAC3 domain-containing protein 1 [Sceloporus undulatus]|uniref:SAC3 domain-containing protein 1 n=1 Tax=Sceloporus undulatus TaxID=8520 RepID=UPI001C4AB9EA|nr:SAC3 domain-containing protein 1 [Sceloporus undulatus]XP_042296073.1 SAC3 domain-containing protein 1 [Sceloporus undulatus]
MGGAEPAKEVEELPETPKPLTIVGTCATMCPASEFARRLRQGRLHRLELGPAPECRPEPSRAVKEYSRPAAGKPPPSPEELRPPAMLLATIQHLLGLESGEVAVDRYAFVADRLRAIRLDLTLQRLAGQPCTIAILERALVFLLHSGHHLCTQPPTHFDAHLHRAHLQESFAALRRAYRQDRDGARHASATEPRFQALFLLYNLGSTEALRQILQLPENVRTSPELSTALAINWAFLERNFARFFRLARGLPYLPSCALHQHFANARREALLTFSHGFNARNCRYPLSHLAQLLALDDAEDAAKLCQAHGLAMADGGVVFQKGSFKDTPALAHWPSCLLVDSKRGNATLRELAESVCS